MEHQTISGWYQDSVGIPYPSVASQPVYSYLPPGNVDASGVITKKSVINTPGGSNWVIPVVPKSDVQGSRVLRNASLSMALVSLQETGTSGSGNFVEAAIEFYWAVRYIPSGSTPTQPGTQLNFAGSTPGLSLFADSQFTLASGMYLGNDRSISIAFPSPVVL